MIYQMTLYFGAIINEKVIYSGEITFDDCTQLLKEPVNFTPFKEELIRLIEKDGFNPNDFTYDWITKEQYSNKIESKVEMDYEIK
jgi:hypothetical protein